MEKEPVTESVDLKGQMELNEQIGTLLAFTPASEAKKWWIRPPDFDYRIRRTDNGLPDFCNDLNAMHEAEKLLTHQQQSDYSFTLTQGWLSDRIDNWRAVHATAEQRCKAFVEVMGASSVGAGTESDTAGGASSPDSSSPSSLVIEEQQTSIET